MFANSNVWQALQTFPTTGPSKQAPEAILPLIMYGPTQFRIHSLASLINDAGYFSHFRNCFRLPRFDWPVVIFPKARITALSGRARNSACFRAPAAIALCVGAAKDWWCEIGRWRHRSRNGKRKGIHERKATVKALDSWKNYYLYTK